ncbi:GAP1-N1 domain-containing protein [Vibrio harveyi]
MAFIHQTFHGYSNGHKLLASSINLDADAKKIMLRESDSPGDAFHKQTAPCYTGYPLVESGFYVLSKTWNAFEVDRPGCVWTHSILIPFQYLENIASSFNVIKFFDESLAQLDDLQLLPIDMGMDYQNSMSDLSIVSMYISYLFGPNSSNILSQKCLSISNIISILDFLWPALRYSFSFRTWAPKKLSSYSNYQNYNLILSDIDEEQSYGSDWFKSVIDNVDFSELKKFIWHYGSKKSSDLYNLSTAYLYLKEQNINKLSNHILRWKDAPRNLAIDAIKLVQIDNISLHSSYLLGSYILLLKSGEVADEVLSETGFYIYNEDKAFFDKIIDASPQTLPIFINKVIGELSSERVLSLYDKGHISSREIMNKSSELSNDLWMKFISNGEVESFTFDDLSHLPLPKEVVQLVDYLSFDKQSCAEFLTCNIKDLSSVQLKYLYDNYIDYLSNTNISLIKNEKFNDGLIDHLTVEDIIEIDDSIFCKIFSLSSKSEIVCRKTLWSFILGFNKKRECLFFSSIYYLIDFVSYNNVSFNEKYEMRTHMRRKINDKYFFPISFKDMFFSYMYAYIKENNIHPSSNKDCKLIKKIESNAIKNKPLKN